MQAAATEQLQLTTSSVEALNDTPQPPAADVEASLLDRAATGLSQLWEDTTDSWAAGDRLDRLQKEVEASVSAIVDLIVVFVLQTLLLPIAALWLCWRGLAALWRRPEHAA